MNHHFINMIRTQSSIANNANTLTDLGVVSAYDSQNYLVRVQLYPEDDTNNTPALETGWIPLFTPWAGNGWGLFLPPNIGDVIEVHYQAGSLQNGYAALRSFSIGSPANPQNVPSGEFWLVHASGSLIKLTNDGNMTINAQTQVDITAPVVNITSPEVNIGQAGSLLALLNSTAAEIYNTHTHASIGAPPVPLMTSENETTNTTAS